MARKTPGGLAAGAVAVGTKAEVRLGGSGIWGEIERVQCQMGGGAGSLTAEDCVTLIVRTLS